MDAPEVPWRAFRSPARTLGPPLGAAAVAAMGIAALAAAEGAGEDVLLVGMVVVGLGTWLVSPLLKTHRLRLRPHGLEVNGVTWTWRRSTRLWSDARILAGVERAGGSVLDAVRFVARREARKELAPLGPAAVLAGDALGAVVQLGAGHRPRWGYAAVVRGAPPELVGTWLTPEALLAAHDTLPGDAVVYLAGYETGAERRVRLPIVHLGLAMYDPFFSEAAARAEPGGALEPLGAGSHVDLARSVGGFVAAVGADDLDRVEIPEVDAWLDEPPSAGEWPARLAALLAFRAVGGPHGILEPRVFAVLRRWRGRGDDAADAFAGAWRVLLGRADDPVRWPDDLSWLRVS